MAQKKSKSKEGYSASYKSGNKQAKNRRIKLERLLKQQPNNKQIEMALKDIKYRRHTPKAPVWSHSDISLAKILKEFTGHFNQEILSSNSKTAAEALSSLPTKNSQYSMPKEVAASISNKAMFSLMARARIRGEYVWANTGSFSEHGIH